MSWSSPLFDLALVREEEFLSDTVEGVVDVLVPYLGVAMESTNNNVLVPLQHEPVKKAIEVQ